MEVKNLYDAISTSLEKLGYDNIEMIRKLIFCALNGETNCFTRTNKAREYIESKSKNDILKELHEVCYSEKNDIEQLVKNYISIVFSNKKYNEETYNKISVISNLSKIETKIRNININSNTDDELNSNVWNYFIDVFSGKNNVSFSREELKYDMIEAALKVYNSEKGNVQILSNPVITDTNLTSTNDAIFLVDRFVSIDKLDELLVAIDKNSSLSGLLLKNMFDCAYFDKVEKNTNDYLIDLDKVFINSNMDLKDKAKILFQALSQNYQIAEENNLENIDLLKETNPSIVKIEMLKNSIILNMYTTKKDYMDFEERRLYAGDKNIDEEVIHSRIRTNSEIVNDLLLDKDIDNIVNIIESLNEKKLHFLTNIFIISRSLKENRDILKNEVSTSIQKEKHYLLGILDNKELLEKLDKTELVK